MLEELFKTPTTAKLVEYLVSVEEHVFLQKDLKMVSASNPSIYAAIKILERFKLIIKVRKIAKATLYKVNARSPLYPILKKLVMELSIRKYEVERNGR